MLSLSPVKFMDSLRCALEAVSEYSGRIVSWLSLALVLVVGYDVFTRYLLRSSKVYVQELQWHLFALLFLLSTAYGLKHERHVRVDIFYQRFGPKMKAWVNLLGVGLFLLPFCFVMIATSVPYVWNSFSIGETSPDPGGLPARYLLKASLPLAYVLVLAQGLALAMRSCSVLLQGEKEGSPN